MTTWSDYYVTSVSQSNILSYSELEFRSFVIPESCWFYLSLKINNLISAVLNSEFLCSKYLHLSLCSLPYFPVITLRCAVCQCFIIITVHVSSTYWLTRTLCAAPQCRFAGRKAFGSSTFKLNGVEAGVWL